MSFSIPTITLPKGFHLSRSGDGCPAITYRTTGMLSRAFFEIVLLAGWTAGCIFFTWVVLYEWPLSRFWGVLLLVSIWAIEIYGFLSNIAWYFWSVTTFTFCADRLVLERVLFGYSRRSEFPKQAIHAVRQIKG